MSCTVRKRKTSLDELSKLLYGGKGGDGSNKREFHRWGTVASKNADGSYQVALNYSGTTSRCAALCACAAGDRVLVLTMRSGETIIVGKRQ